MLYESWLRVVEKHSDQTAVFHPGKAKALRFLDIHERSQKIALSSPEVYQAHASHPDFFPTIVAAWKKKTPLVLLDSPKPVLKPILGGIPSETSLIKQACGSSGCERSLFFTEEQLLAEAQLNIDTFSLTPSQRSLCVISLAHSYGLGCLTLPLLLGGIPIEILASPFPAFLSECFQKEGSVFLPAVPALWKTWHNSRVIQAPKISLGVSAGSPLSLELENSIWESTGLKIHNFYGTSETGAIAYDSSNTPRLTQSLLGKLLPNVSVIIDQKNHLCVQSPALASGADKLLTPTEFSASHLQTMDQGALHQNSLHWHQFQGNAINIAGRKISPERIKRHCLALPDVLQVEIEKIRSEDFERFEEAKIKVKTSNQTPLRLIKRQLANTLDGWEIPRLWEKL